MRERATGLVERIGGASPPQPRTPNDRVVRRRLRQALSQRGIRKLSSKLARGWRRQPDAVVIRRLASRLVDVDLDQVDLHHRVVDLPKTCAGRRFDWARCSSAPGRAVAFHRAGLPSKEAWSANNEVEPCASPCAKASARTASASAKRPSSPASVSARAIAAFSPRGDASGTRPRLSGRPRDVPPLLHKCQARRQTRHDQAGAECAASQRLAASNRLESMSALACFSPA